MQLETSVRHSVEGRQQNMLAGGREITVPTPWRVRTAEIVHRDLISVAGLVVSVRQLATRVDGPKQRLCTD